MLPILLFSHLNTTFLKGMLYIRHGEKSYKNGHSNTYSLDPELTENGKHQAYKFFQSLLPSHNIPSQIISSPYLRARETAKIAQDVILNSTNNDIPIYYDPHIGEYLGNQKHINLQNGLHPETLSLNPISHESFHQYKLRIRKHISQAKSNCWYITHGLVLQSIAYFNGCKIEYPEPLGTINVSNGVVTVI